MKIKSLTIGGLNIGNTPDSTYRILQFYGLENPATRLPSFLLPQDHGGILENWKYDYRVLRITIQIVADSESDYADASKALMTALTLDRDTQITFIVTMRNGKLFALQGMPRMITKHDDFGQRTYGTVGFEVLVPKVRMLDSAAQLATIYLPNVSGGTAIPTAIPTEIGSVASAGITTCSNGGNISSPPYITIRGICTNPIVENLTSGKKIKINVTHSDSTDYIYIDIENENILDQDGNSLMSYLDLDKRDFFYLEQGDNEIQFGHEGVYNANTYCQLVWQDAYIGL